jgi:hypothetical protein
MSQPPNPKTLDLEEILKDLPNHIRQTEWVRPFGDEMPLNIAYYCLFDLAFEFESGTRGKQFAQYGSHAELDNVEISHNSPKGRSAKFPDRFTSHQTRGRLRNLLKSRENEGRYALVEFVRPKIESGRIGVIVAHGVRWFKMKRFIRFVD